MSLFSSLHARAISFLQLLGRYTKMDMLYFAKGGFWLTLGQLVASGSVFLLAVAFANLLPQSVYGTYKYILSVAALFSIFTLPGLDTALTREIARGFDGSVHHALFVRMRWGLLGALAALLTALYYAGAHDFVLAGGMLIIAVFLPFFDASNLYTSYQLGKKNFRESTWCYALVQGGSVAVLIATSFVTTDVIPLIFAYFASYTTLRFLCLWHVLRKVPKDAERSPEMLPYAKHLTAIGIVSQVTAQADKILLFHFVGAVEVAFYSVATALGEQLRAFLNAADFLLFPKFVSQTKEDISRNIGRTMLLLFIAALLVVIAYILIAPWAFDIFFPQYRSAVLLSQVYSVSLLSIAFLPASVYLRTHKRVTEMYWGNLIASVFQLASMAILTIMWGLWGLVIARVLSRFFSSALSLGLMYWFPKPR